jgi:hypothetical protein
MRIYAFVSEVCGVWCSQSVLDVCTDMQVENGDDPYAMVRRFGGSMYHDVEVIVYRK